MSAGRREWSVTRYEHVDRESGLLLCVETDGVTWSWEMTRRGYRGHVARGGELSPSAAKGAAGKALDAAKAVTP